MLLHSIRNNSHFRRQIQCHTTLDCRSIGGVAEESSYRVDKCGEAHSNSEDSATLNHVLRLLQLVFQRQYL